MGTIIQPGAGFDLSAVSTTDMEEAREWLAANPAPGSVLEQIIRNLLSIIPVNPVDAMAKGDVLAIMLGIATLMAGEAGEPVARVMNSAADVMMKLTIIIMEVAPIGALR
jgi:Na+/H+-dicarboxylate symporter